MLRAFDVVPDYDLDVMQSNQTLFDITGNILNKIKVVLKRENSDIVLVHGDTSTTFVTALACFYMRVPVGHVEARLRTYNNIQPLSRRVQSSSNRHYQSIQFCSDPPFRRESSQGRKEA